MTTTHTFQGLNIDSKPSSRVLNPPGGSSSNIFGCDDQPKQQASVKSKHEGISREKTDAVGHGDPAVTAGPQQKSWAPRSVFNPITGEPYEQPKSKQEPLLPVVIHSESRTIADSCSAAELNQVTGSLATADHGKPQPIAPTSAHLKQHQSGLFGGGAENVREHRSTRVSQPPGGRSTKLW